VLFAFALKSWNRRDAKFAKVNFFYNRRHEVHKGFFTLSPLHLCG
jgi:hypothetical protein